MAMTQNNISAKQDWTSRRKCQFQYQSGVDLDVPERKIKVTEREHYPQSQTISIMGVLWIVRQNTGMQKRTSRASYPGYIASSGVSAASPLQVAVGPLMPWWFICVCLWYKAWRVYPALLLPGYACGSLHPFLSAHWGRKLLEKLLLWRLKLSFDNSLRCKVQSFTLCMAQLSFQVKPLLKICWFSFCGIANSPVFVLWSCSRD